MNIKFIGKAKLTKQGQLTLPLEARQDLKIDLNTDVYWYEIDDHLVIVKELMSQKDLEAMLKKKNSQK